MELELRLKGSIDSLTKRSGDDQEAVGSLELFTQLKGVLSIPEQVAINLSSPSNRGERKPRWSRDFGDGLYKDVFAEASRAWAQKIAAGTAIKPKAGTILIYFEKKKNKYATETIQSVQCDFLLKLPISSVGEWKYRDSAVPRRLFLAGPQAVPLAILSEADVQRENSEMPPPLRSAASISAAGSDGSARRLSDASSSLYNTSNGMYILGEVFSSCGDEVVQPAQAEVQSYTGPLGAKLTQAERILTFLVAKEEARLDKQGKLKVTDVMAGVIMAAPSIDVAADKIYNALNHYWKAFPLLKQLLDVGRVLLCVVEPSIASLALSAARTDIRLQQLIQGQQQLIQGQQQLIQGQQQLEQAQQRAEQAQQRGMLTMAVTQAVGLAAIALLILQRNTK